MWRGRLVAMTFLPLALVVLSACSSPPSPSRRSAGSKTPSIEPRASLPPIPTESGGRGAEQAPVAWIGGTITAVAQGQLVLKEAEGPKVTLKRLGQGATVVFRASGGAWVRIDPDTGLDQGEQACVETLLSGHNLLALRVFLGADCGPTG